VRVTVQGLLVESGETVFRGSAHYPHCVDLSGETFRNLTCQAAATAWGFRPSGQLDIPSSLMCRPDRAHTDSLVCSRERYQRRPSNLRQFFHTTSVGYQTTPGSREYSRRLCDSPWCCSHC
jgi:hypothetical protein